MNKQNIADLSLLAVTFIWGTTFVIMKQAIESLPAFSLLGIRFIMAALMMAVIFRKQLAKLDLCTVKRGSVIGFFLFIGYVLNTFGLYYTTASKSGFISAACVVMVPFLSPLVTKEKPGISEFSAAFITFIGLCALTLSEGFNEINFGDILTFASAVAYAFQIIFISKYSKTSNNYNSSFIQILFVGVFSIIFAFIFEGLHLPAGGAVWGKLVYLSFFATALAFTVQNISQKYTTPVRASVIFSLEPLFSAIFAFIFMSERLTAIQSLGGILIVSGTIVAELDLIPRFLAKFSGTGDKKSRE